MHSKESKVASPEAAPVLLLTDEELAAISGGGALIGGSWGDIS